MTVNLKLSLFFLFIKTAAIISRIVNGVQLKRNSKSKNLKSS